MKEPQTQYVRNAKQEIVMITGLLPDGTYGQIADEARPFTEDELNSPDKFNEHIADLNRRLGWPDPSLGGAK